MSHIHKTTSSKNRRIHHDQPTPKPVILRSYRTPDGLAPSQYPTITIMSNWHRVLAPIYRCLTLLHCCAPSLHAPMSAIIDFFILNSSYFVIIRNNLTLFRHIKHSMVGRIAGTILISAVWRKKNCHFMCLSFGATTLLEQRYDSIFLVL
jgi:hypothetical protein